MKNKNLKILTLSFILLFLFLAIPTVFSADTNDIIGVEESNTLDDFIAVNNTNAEGNFTNLDEAIANLGDDGVIDLTGDIQLNNNSVSEEVKYSKGISINKTLTINGNSHIISGTSSEGNSTRIFYINSGTITLKNMVLKDTNFLTDGGGAIKNRATLNLINVTFINNNAYIGGAIFNQHGLLTVINSTFINNSAKNCGGAIFSNYGFYTVDNSQFNLNYAFGNETFVKGFGGAIHGNESAGSITNSEFISNFANCGAVSGIHNSFLTVNNSKFIDNYAIMAGAIIVYSNSTLNIDNSYFENNTGNSSGGALYCDNSTLTLDNSVLNNNNATIGGGAISNFYGNIVVNNSTLKNNYADYDGGAIYGYHGDLILTNSILNNNFGKDKGGGVFWRVGNVNITNSILINNKNKNGNNSIHLYLLTTVISLENNWWGNTLENKNLNPNQSQISYSQGVKAPVNSWMVLNINGNPDSLDINGKSNITVDLLHNQSGDIVDSFKLDNIPVSLTCTNGNLTNNNGTLINREFTTIFTKTNESIAKIMAIIYNVSTSTLITSNDMSNTTIISENISLNYHSGAFSAIITDINGVTLSGKTIIFTVNGVNYTRISNDDGLVKLNINLAVGNYSISTSFLGDNKYNPSNKTNVINVNRANVTPEVHDLKMDYKEGSKFNAIIKDENGKVAVNLKVQFTVNGVSYNRTTNEYGIASLNINLKPGNYTVKTLFKNSNYLTVSQTSNLNISPWNISKVELKVDNLTKYYKDSSKFTATLLYDGVAINGETIIINANGKNYSRITDENGSVSLNVNLNVGEYTFTVTTLTTTQGVHIVNTSKVSVLKTNTSLNNTPNIISRGNYLTTTLTNPQTTPLNGEAITLNVNGINYSRITNINGEAYLKINLKPGNYTLTSIFNGSNNCLSSNCQTLITVIE